MFLLNKLFYYLKVNVCILQKSGDTQLASDSGSSGSLFCQVKSGPPSVKTDCLKKRKPALTRSTWGRPLSSLNAPKSNVYHASDA